MKRVEKNVVQAFNDIDINELNKKMMVDNIQFFSFQILLLELTINKLLTY